MTPSDDKGEFAARKVTQERADELGLPLVVACDDCGAPRPLLETNTKQVYSLIYKCADCHWAYVERLDMPGLLAGGLN